MRAFLYALARLFGDVKAVQRGTIHKRIVNKFVGRKVMARLWWR